MYVVETLVGSQWKNHLQTTDKNEAIALLELNAEQEWSCRIKHNGKPTCYEHFGTESCSNLHYSNSDEILEPLIDEAYGQMNLCY